MSNASTVSGTKFKAVGSFFYFFCLRLARAVLGIVGYVVQVSLRHLTTPWYLPFTAIFGLVFVGVSISRQRTLWRWLAFFGVICIAAFEGAFLYGVRLPAYTGPLEIGKPYPAFQTQLADGKPFTEADFKGNEKTVLVFFRGRW